MTEPLPLFPLGLVLYPTEQLPLHIFEPRYKQMIRACLESDSVFGIVLQQDGGLARVGCTARVQQVIKTYEDGRMDIVVRGEERFELGDVVSERAYLEVQANELPEVSGTMPQGDARERVITQHMKLLELAGRDPEPAVYEERDLLSFFIGHNAGLSLEQRQELLEMSDEAGRIDFLVAHLEQFLPRVEEAEALRRKITSNGHFPDFPLGDLG